ncbi:uncharacterized protein LOC115083765 [Rhinatrema bivittatum]|uniref:uncharacterized protein LOC115083765 n=1 Tax=Rhinatrema bivittatum TaxID=194408 RepID=UPI001127EF82|nr:uncharacterized protein LOC115083765 [Rhinatrema bivittatum]XP_029443649.1 uncharacterized protein LOC115083765 [Rhinatrema bivittatum]
MGDQDRELGERLVRHHARVRAVHLKLGFPMQNNIQMPFRRAGVLSQDGKSQEAKIANLPLTAAELPKEVLKHFGPLGAEIMRQSYSEHLKLGSQGRSVSSAPKQEMIDIILAMRNIQNFDRKIQNAEIIKKLNENKELLKKELKGLQLHKKHFQNVPSEHAGNKQSLKNRIIATMKHLPELEARVQHLREELNKETEQRLRPYLGESLLVGAEPYQIRIIIMVRALLDEMVEEMLDDYLKRDPESSGTTELNRTLLLEF